MTPIAKLLLLAATLVAAGCGEVSRLPDAAVTGPDPEIAAPEKTLVPTVHIAPAKG
jgi:hypothetical protein